MAQNGHLPPSNGEPVVMVDRVPDNPDQMQVSIISGSTKTAEVTGVKSGDGTGPTLHPSPSVDDLEKQARERKPIWYCRVITTYPKTSFGVTLGLHISMVVLTMLLLYAGVDLFPIKFGNLPLDIVDDVDYLRGLAWQERTETDDVIDRNALAEAVQLERSVMAERVELYFEDIRGNVFTKENLQRIKEVEEEFFNNAKYRSGYCQLDKNANETERKCILPGSVLRYFDGSLEHINAAFSDPNFENITGVLSAAEKDNRTWVGLQSYLGKDSVINDTVAISEITYSVLYVGLPLKGYANDTYKEDTQKKKLEDFLVDAFQDKARDYFEDGVGDMDFFYFSESLFLAEISLQSMLDMSLAVGSLFFITLFVCFQTRSFWVSLWAVLSILCCFATTNLIYRLVVDFRYFGIFHILSIFIILGIGADNVFILFDTWKESAHYEFPSLAHRLSFVYRRASFAMLFTSLTTAIAFIVSAFSPFLGVSTFGVFSGILVTVNYLSVIIFLPTVVITYHLYWDKYQCCCCCQRYSNDPMEQKKNQKKNVIVRFFAGPYFRFVTHKIFRWVILVVFAGAIATFIYFASKLEVNEERIKFLADDTNFGKYLARREVAFRPVNVDSSTRVLLVWGMKKQDIGGCHHTEVECYGHNVWDDTFDLNTPQAQDALLALCQTIKDLSKEKQKELWIRSDQFTDIPEVQCFLEDMEDFLKKEEDYYPVDTKLDMPTNISNAELIMTLNTAAKDNTVIYYNSSALLNDDDFHNYFEVAMSYWLYGGFSNILEGKEIADQYYEYDRYLGESEYPPHTIGVELYGGEYIYHYGTKLRYAAIAINTTIQSADMPYSDGLKIRDAWEEFMQEELEKLPESLQGGFQISAVGGEDFNLWHWFKIQNRLVSTALIGIIVGVCFALPILIIATMNVITGLLATGVIIVITVSVVGLLPMAGWKLGLLESLNFVLVVGLSVDYVVHLAEGYSRSVKPDRLGRLHDTLEEVGVSVLSGAITTLGASFFLLFAVILFFTQFGYFMFGTIGFSIAYSLGLFVTVMGLIGPENDFGSLRPLFRKCCPSKN